MIEEKSTQQQTSGLSTQLWWRLSGLARDREAPRRHLENILPEGRRSFARRCRSRVWVTKPFELMCAHDLEGIVAKRLKDPYGSRTRWLKIKNPGCSQ